MQEEIKLIIQKNLPAEVGNVLKARLEKADQDELAIKVVTERKIQLEAREKELLSEIEKYKKFDERNKALDEREKILRDKEITAEVEQLKFQVTVEREKAQFTKEVALGLVRNTEFRKQVFDSENQTPYYQGSTYVNPTPVNKNLTENRKAE